MSHMNLLCNFIIINYRKYFDLEAIRDGKSLTSFNKVGGYDYYLKTL